MIVLDTNVISEIMRPVPDPYVMAWLAAQNSLSLTTTTITIAEIQRGICRLPTGRKREGLAERFDGFVAEAFSNRVLSLDIDSAYLCGDVSEAREAKGLHADTVDMMIASIAKRVGAKLATRNIKDFEGCGIKLINPWEGGA